MAKQKNTMAPPRERSQNNPRPVSRGVSLSVVLLAYNEEASVEAAVDACVATLATLPGEHEVMVIDDGSTDRTARRARRAAAGHERVRVISHGQNRGMGAGMRTGVLAARGTHFTMLAADLQVRPEAILSLLPLLGEADIVLSGYHRRDDGALRTLYSWGFRQAMARLAHIRVDLEGIYLFPTDVAREELAHVHSDTFLFSFELIDRAMARGLTTAHTLIQCYPREEGSSKVTSPRKIWTIFREIVKIRQMRVRRGEPK